MKSRSSYWQLLPFISPQWQTIARALGCTLIFTIFWPLLAALVGNIARYIGEGDVDWFSFEHNSLTYYFKVEMGIDAPHNSCYGIDFYHSGDVVMIDIKIHERHDDKSQKCVKRIDFKHDPCRS